MLKPLSLVKINNQIKSTQNKDTILMKMLSDSLKHKFNSQTYFFVSIIVLRLLKQGILILL